MKFIRNRAKEMILYEKTNADPGVGHLEWWAADADTLTLAHCRMERGRKFSLRFVRWNSPTAVATSFPEPFDFGEAAISLLIGCREFRQCLSAMPAAIMEMDLETTEIPEYILLGPARGPAEAIMHTTDPRFIARFPDGPNSGNPKDHFVSWRSSAIITDAGWEYWRADAWQEFVSQSARVEDPPWDEFP